jgi:hypothetical protein
MAAVEASTALGPPGNRPCDVARETGYTPAYAAKVLRLLLGDGRVACGGRKGARRWWRVKGAQNERRASQGHVGWPHPDEFWP